MIFLKLQIYKLLVTTFVLCYLTMSVYAATLTKSQSVVSVTDVAASHEAEVPVTEAANIKSSEENDELEDNEAAEKNAVQPAADTSVSAWSILSGLWNWIKEDISESIFGDDGKSSAVGDGRTFGKIRRLQMALIPIVFKFGVLSAMVAFLVALGIKTLFLVKVLIVMNLLALLAKFFTLKTNFGHLEHFPVPPAPIWSPYVSNGWHSIPEKQHINKEVHLHIHGAHLQQPQGYANTYENIAASQPQGWERRNDPYSAYEAMALQGPQNESVPKELPSSASPLPVSGQQYSASFPGNHRMFYR